MKLRIGIVGASIAGSTLSILLSRLGYDITLFERSSNSQYPDLGAGIWLPPSLIATLKAKNILPQNFASLPVEHRPIYRYAADDDEDLLSTHPLNARSVHWLDLYMALKAARPKENIIYNAEITQLNQDQNQVTLTVSEHEEYHFDYVFFCDGNQSIGRKYVYPHLKPTFVDTIIWRGILDRDCVKNADRILKKGSFFVTPQGHMLIYPVPNRLAEDPLKEYKINWLFYEHVSKDHPLFYNTNNNPEQNIAKGHLPKDYQEYLLNLAKQHLPPFARNIISSTIDPFIQAMYELYIPNQKDGRIILLGDASTVLRPHTAAGSTRAIQSALQLEKLLAENKDFNKTLEKWSKRQQQESEKQFHIGQTLGELFVTNMPDWQKLQQQDIDKLWYECVKDKHCWYAVCGNKD